MKMKTNELTGAALDWAVAKCEGFDYFNHQSLARIANFVHAWEPSLIWSQGGPIIEREKITLEWTGEDWMAYIRHDEEFFGSTPLIAAMRCFVASKISDEVDVPAELED